jgi:DNA-binding GntR family transcriptional regulator
VEPLSLPRVERHLNLTDSVYAALKTAIIENTLAAGSRLTEAAIAEQIGVSNTPVREAISRLEREGLVHFLPRRGAVVVSITAEDIREVLEVREVLEAHAIVRALQRRTPELDRRLSELVEQAEALVAASDQHGYSRLDMEFHRLLVQASGNGRLLRVFENMHDQFLMIRWRAFDLPGRPLAGQREHQEILAAFLTGDPLEAERRLRWHHQHTRQDLEKALAGAGGKFGN